MRISLNGKRYFTLQMQIPKLIIIILICRDHLVIGKIIAGAC